MYNVYFYLCKPIPCQLFHPKRQPDNSLIWDLPLGQGKVPLIALSDFGFFTRHIFDNPTKYSGFDLEVASEMVSWDQVVETFERVIGKENGIGATYKDVNLDEYFQKRGGGNWPAAKEAPEGVRNFLHPSVYSITHS
jgi:hypothetical protein